MFDLLRDPRTKPDGRKILINLGPTRTGTFKKSEWTRAGTQIRLKIGPDFSEGLC